MKNAIKKGFTIVELVIVIAVIAVLAGVLIPTFSGVVKKANLSADKQAVREMNMALQADESIHGKPANIETVMQVLANAGYNSDNWCCLTNGYEVYWYETDNRLILYNASTAEVEYPETYSVDLMISNVAKFHIYNENHIQAINSNISLGSSDGANTKSASDLASLAGSSASSQAALNSLSSALDSTGASSNEALRKALGLTSSDGTQNSQAYVYGTREITNGKASMQVLSVGSTSTPSSEELKSNGDLKENVFYISVNTAEDASPQEIASAQKNAGDFVYTIFTQINTSQLDKDVCIVFPADTVLDVSGKEWSAVKEFEGYFGTEDPDHPLVINGAQLSNATGYSQTVSFTGTSSKYFVTGFFGTVYGNTTIENVVFKNIKIDQPAMDFEIGSFKLNGKPIDSRNTVGIIGGITDKAAGIPCNVVVRNVVVDETCELICGADGGILVGYVGSAEDKGDLQGTVVIEGCKANGKILSEYQYISASYGPVGGLIGFTCRAGQVDITIRGCEVSGTVDGTTIVGAAIGNVLSYKSLTFENYTDAKGVVHENDFSGVTINERETGLKVGSLIGSIADNLYNKIVFNEDPILKEGLKKRAEQKD